jgi:type I restriction enzyme S subunit
MPENAKKPAVRFTGFDDAWEQRKLGDETDILAGGDVDKSSLSEKGRYPVIANALTGDGIVGYYDDEYRIKAPAVTVTGRGDVGHAQARIVDFTPVVRLLSVKSTHDVNFLENAINNHKVVIESTGVPQLTAPQLSKYQIWFASPDEETKIGAFFMNLNNLITLHQRKYEKLVSVKKSMLEKMFPKNGSNIPEIRFAGFTDPWEQRKLGDVTTRIVRKNQDLESTLPLTISSQYGLVDQITYFNNRVASRDVRNYYLVKKGEFAYNKSYSDGFPFGAVKRLDHYEMGVLSTLYIIFALNTDVMDSDYLVSYYETNNWHKEIAVRAAEGARNHGLLNISANDFFDTALKYPRARSEQAQIGRFFKQLDNLITLHQRKLEKLKNVKKAMLDKMFV